MYSLCFSLVLLAFPIISSAWSYSGGGASSRRIFLENTAMQTSVAILVGTGFVENAEATTDSWSHDKGSVYNIPPGSLSGQGNYLVSYILYISCAFILRKSKYLFLLLYVVHVITGASSGLGLESAKRLAAAGATVVMTTRTAEKGDIAKRHVESYLSDRSIAYNKDTIHAIPINFDNLEEVRSFPERYRKEMGDKKIDVLLNNVGRINQKREMTNDGFEKTFQSNHLGSFMLTAGLFQFLNRNGARIVNVASRAHQFAKDSSTGKQGLDMSNLQGELSYGLSGWEAYGQTKLENILFTEELQRRADTAGLGWLTVTCLHPGVVGTELWNNTALARSNNNGLQSIMSNFFLKNVALTNEEGANTQLYLATTPIQDDKFKGRYFDEYGNMVDLDPFARDESKAKELWEVSERLSSCKFNVE